MKLITKYFKLRNKQIKDIEYLENSGWLFHEDEQESGHNGSITYFIVCLSPRGSKVILYSIDLFRNIKKDLLESDAEYLARQKIEENTDYILEKYIKIYTKKFKNPKTQFMKVKFKL